MLVPTIGLVPVGLQAMADRYMYLPSIGVFVAAVWAVADISARWRFREGILALVTVPLLAACGWLTWAQTWHWRDSLSLWTHCLAVAPESALAHYNLAATYLDLGRPAEAIAEYRAALRLKPDDADANLNLGAALTANGAAGEATNYFAKVLQLRPGDSKALMNMALALAELGDFEGALAHCNQVIAADPLAYGAYTCRGRILSAQGKSDEAILSYLEALRVNASNYETLYHLGMEYLKQGKTEGAIPAFRKAQELDPTNPLAHVLLAAALDMAHRTGDAVPEYREALRLRPDWPEALNNLAWILATHPDEKLRNGAEAVALASRACERTGGQQAVFVGTLAAAHAEAGQFDKAVEIAQKACDLAAARGDLELVKRNQDLLELFRNHKPYREAK
jgi:protein O-mannosyl-transferase